MSTFDKEYYVISVDGENNHPLLAWGKTNFGSFLKAQPIDEKEYELPLQIIFDEPYPSIPYEIADLLMLASLFAVSGKFKKTFEEKNIYGIQFVPIEIKDNQGEVIREHHVFHIWNKLPAIDKNNYEGSEPNRFGNILSLNRFSLDYNVLNALDLDKRLIFGLSENSTMYIVHQSIYDMIQSANLSGMKFFRVDDWDEDALFR